MPAWGRRHEPALAPARPGPDPSWAWLSDAITAYQEPDITRPRHNDQLAVVPAHVKPANLLAPDLCHFLKRHRHVNAVSLPILLTFVILALP